MTSLRNLAGPASRRTGKANPVAASPTWWRTMPSLTSPGVRLCWNGDGVTDCNVFIGMTRYEVSAEGWFPRIINCLCCIMGLKAQ